MDKQKKFNLCVGIIIGFHILNIFFFVLGQGGSVIDYDAIARMGLVEARESIDAVLVTVNQGIGFADVLIGVPLFILAVIGLWRRKFWGALFSWMIFGISFYWTAVAWAKQYFYLAASVKCEAFDAGTHLMLSFVFLFSVWGSWFLYKNRELLKSR